jgi:hypothetical protein
MQLWCPRRRVYESYPTPISITGAAEVSKTLQLRTADTASEVNTVLSQDPLPRYVVLRLHDIELPVVLLADIVAAEPELGLMYGAQGASPSSGSLRSLQSLTPRPNPRPRPEADLHPS